MSSFPASTREWDAASYDRVSGFQLALGLEVLERLPLEGDETVLDAGCGSGRVTRALLERLPRGRVVAVDSSSAMVDRARAALGDERVSVLCVDLADLELSEPVDAVLSTAVFHWVPDHARLFARLREALRPGGRLVAQCGGEGNIEAFRGSAREVAGRETFAPAFESFVEPWRFDSAEEAEALLVEAGFAEPRCWLEPRTVRPEEPLEFIRTVCLGHHLERLPEDLRQPFVQAVAATEPQPLQLDYVRLNIDARRPA